MATPPSYLRDNPYARRPEDIREPPRTWARRLLFIGPSFILIGSIVGSGELIMTTSYGAAMGFSVLWFILVSCLSKTIIQAELGRYTISSGDTALQAFDRVPGPRWHMSWLMWLWVVWQIPGLVTGGGILGGVGKTMHAAFGGPDDRYWTLFVALFTVAILLYGRYAFLEGGATFMVVAFSVITVICAILLQRTDYAIRPHQIAAGLQFSPAWEDAAQAMLAVGTFAGTGVSAGELMAYTYWCVEKGYARYSGPREDSPSWTERARGWIRVMHLDVILCTAIFTLATLAFFALGAGILHRIDPQVTDAKLIQQLSRIYTESLGPLMGKWALLLFLLGSFFVLYSTVFSGLAGTTRSYADALAVSGAVPFRNFAARMRWIRVFTVLVPLCWTVAYFLIAAPKAMITIGGVINAMMLPVVAGVTIWLRYRGTDKSIRPGRVADLVLWVCFAILIVVAGAFIWWQTPLFELFGGKRGP